MNRHFRPGFGCRHHTRQVAGAFNIFAVEFQHHIRHLQTAFSRRTVFLHIGNQCATRTIQTKRVGQVRVDFLNRHAQPATRHLAAGFKLVGHIHRHVNRDRERHALITTIAAVYLRVHAHHFTAQVKQRPTGIARINRHIGLNKRHVVFGRQRTPLGRDNAGSHAVLKSERRTNRHHGFAHTQFFRVAYRDFGQVAGVDLDDGDVGALVITHNLGGELALVSEFDCDFVHTLNHMRVSKYETIIADDKSGTFAARGHLAQRRLRLAFRCPAWREKLAEEIHHFVVSLHARKTARGESTVGLLHDFCGADIDHGGAVLFDKF